METNPMRVFKFENIFKETEYIYQCGAALAIVAAKDAEQAKKLMVADKDGLIKAIDGSVIRKSQLDSFDLKNPVEIPCLQTTLNEPTVITISEYYEE